MTLTLAVWVSMAVPDVIRAQLFVETLKGYTAADKMPHLTLVQLPSNHTSGTTPGMNTPKAMVAVTFLQASKRGCAEMLAVSVTAGRSEYYAAFFARRGGDVATLADARGKRVAFGDVNSTSSFVYPVAMLVSAGISPAKDLGKVRLMGNHANSLNALVAGQVDIAALSFESYNKALSAKTAGALDVVAIARSEAIPNPPIIMNSRLPQATKAALRTAFQLIATRPGVTADMVRGYGGMRVDSYDTHFPTARFARVAAKVAMVDARLTGALIERASEH